jgi:hypothetical protein
MTDAAAAPLLILPVAAADACAGDSCVVPAQRVGVTVSSRVDADLV